MAELQFTPVDDIEKIRDDLKAGFASGKLRDIVYRKYQLTQLMYAVKDNLEAFEQTLQKDLGRPIVESRLLELVAIINEFKNLHKNVDKWAKPEKMPFSLNWSPMKPIVRKEPKGTVLVIGPFNYPLWCSLGPVAGAIAAGCTVLLKPSEQTPATTALLTEVIHKYLDHDVFRIVNGGIPETTKVLELQWDHSSGRVGKIVATAAAKHLTPVTLELGGKSPVIVDSSCDVKLTAKRLLWGKAANAGQTCVAPDYVLVPRDFQDTLVNAFKDAYNEFYPNGDTSVAGSYGRLVSEAATERVGKMIQGSKGNIFAGGSISKDTKYIPPTLVKNVSGDDSLMTDEIFGPVLPIVPVENIDEAIKYVNDRPHPLALYVFAKDNQVKKKILENTQSGGFVANDVLLLPGAEGMPFGGTGSSGYGFHTGKYSFDTFTHLRSTLDSPSWVDLVLSFRFPPYTDKKAAAALKMLGSLPSRPKGPPGVGGNSWWGKGFIVALAVATSREELRSLFDFQPGILLGSPPLLRPFVNIIFFKSASAFFVSVNVLDATILCI
ncbi:NAD-aldehyde dehydrogenase [Crepidotus variabilis]|uniref:Aldehyde dehydrogenase n=1 Tax=Crepidotus variabilis TaxID=179855 RepID=A0A9P6EG63_9AGAR|nr:NAD-aldehyde dehydrogenase [Crepidotus variabilis]